MKPEIRSPSKALLLSMIQVSGNVIGIALGWQAMTEREIDRFIAGDTDGMFLTASDHGVGALVPLLSTFQGLFR